jgi:hypothetical protein
MQIIVTARTQSVQFAPPLPLWFFLRICRVQIKTAGHQ